eukprot:gene16505-18151_t
MNSLVVGLETITKLKRDHAATFSTLNGIFLFIYTSEFILKVYSEPKGYWKSSYNIFDFTVLVLSYVQVVLDNLQVDEGSLEVLRLLRVIRALRTISFVEGLQVLVTALIVTIRKSVVNVVVLLVLLMIFFGVVGYYIFGYDDTGDKERWGSLSGAMLTLFTFVTADGWTQIQKRLDEKFSYSQWFTVIFIFLGHFIFTNLFIGIIIMNIHESTERYNATRKKEREAILQLKKDYLYKRQREDVKQMLRNSKYANFTEMTQNFRRTLRHDDFVLMTDTCCGLTWLETYIDSLDYLDAFSYRNSKSKDHSNCLKRRLELWKNGEFDLLLQEIRFIQSNLEQQQRKKSIEEVSKLFQKIVISGKVNAALRLLSETESKGILPLTDENLALLNQKHPPVEECFDDYLGELKLIDIRLQYDGLKNISSVDQKLCHLWRSLLKSEERCKCMGAELDEARKQYATEIAQISQSMQNVSSISVERDAVITQLKAENNMMKTKVKDLEMQLSNVDPKLLEKLHCILISEGYSHLSQQTVEKQFKTILGNLRGTEDDLKTLKEENHNLSDEIMLRCSNRQQLEVEIRKLKQELFANKYEKEQINNAEMKMLSDAKARFERDYLDADRKLKEMHELVSNLNKQRDIEKLNHQHQLHGIAKAYEDELLKVVESKDSERKTASQKNLEISRIQVEHRLLQGKYSSLESEQSKSLDLIASLEDQSNQLNMEIKSLRQLNQRSASEMEAKRLEMEKNLLGKLAELQSSLVRKESEAENNMINIKEKEIKMQNLSNQLDDMLLAKTALENIIATKEQELQGLKYKVEDFLRKIEEAESLFKKTENEKKEINEKFVNASGEAESLKVYCYQLKNDMNALTVQMTRHQHSFSKEQEKFQNIVNQLTEENGAQKSIMEHERCINENKTKIMRSEIFEMKARMVEKAEEEAKLRERIQVLSKEQIDLKASLMLEEKCKEATEASLLDIEEQFQTTRQKNSELIHTVAALENSKCNLERESDLRSKMLYQIEEMNCKKDLQIKTMTDTNSKLKAELMKSNMENKKLASELSFAQENLQSCISEKKELSHAKIELNRKIEEIEVIKSRLCQEEGHMKLQADLISEFNKQLALFENQVEEKDSGIQNLVDVLQKRNEQLCNISKQHKDIKKEYGSASLKVAELLKENDALRMELVSTSEAYDELKTKADKESIKNENEFRMLGERFEREKHALETFIGQLKNNLQISQERIDAQEKWNESFDEKYRKTKTENASLISEISVFQDKVTSFNIDERKLALKINHLDKENTDLRKSLATLTNDKLSLERLCHQLQNETAAELTNRGYNTFESNANGGYKPGDEEDMTGERGCYFRDGKRKIDFVLVYTEDHQKPTEQKHIDYREKFLSNLRKSHMEMEVEVTEDKTRKVNFIKCHCPFEVLKFYAEEMSFRAPLELRSTVKVNWTERILAKFHLPNPFKEEVPNAPPDFFTTTFRGDKMDKFIGSDNHDTYFTDTQRSRVAYEILETAPYGKRTRGEIGVARLCAEEVFTAAYPLHVGGHKRPREEGPDSPDDEPQMNKRQVLKHYWGRWSKWLKYQPLDHVREYYGEKIGLYFAWLGQYTAWLILPSFVGLLIFLYGFVTIASSDNRDALDICAAKNWTYKMCPLCDENLGCKYWDLKKSCTLAKVSYLFDNAATVFYAVFVSFWGKFTDDANICFFLEFWKRKEITLAYQWDCLGYESEEERPRPTFAALAPTVERNPVTGILEPHFPDEKRKPRLFSGIFIIITMVSLVLIFMLGVIVYKLLVYRPLAMNSLTASHALQIANISGAVCNLICIMILSRVYEKVALALTHWEMHRTQTEYEDNYTFKVFVFQFVIFMHRFSTLRFSRER